MDPQNAYKGEQICWGVVRIKRCAKKTATETAELSMLNEVLCSQPLSCYLFPMLLYVFCNWDRDLQSPYFMMVIFQATTLLLLRCLVANGSTSSDSMPKVWTMEWTSSLFNRAMTEISLSLQGCNHFPERAIIWSLKYNLDSDVSTLKAFETYTCCKFQLRFTPAIFTHTCTRMYISYTHVRCVVHDSVLLITAV